jgi:hypothetical protein
LGVDEYRILLQRIAKLGRRTATGTAIATVTQQPLKRELHALLSLLAAKTKFQHLNLR